jgi:hypothetical protein
MPLILPARTLDSGYEVSNSLRFEDGGSPYLTHTRGTATNEKKFTFSTWVKLGNTGHGVNGTLFGSGDDGNGYVGDALIIQTNGLVKQGDHDSSTDAHNVRTNALLRDPSAWYHIVCAADSTQSTDSNRIKLYINGTQQTSLAATTYPSQDITFDCNTNGQVLNIGRNQNGENNVYFDGYMAETVFIDGQQLTPSSFAETDDNGVWIPKDISGEGLTFGNNGFYLEYKQTGTSANSSGKGADTSGEDTHFDDNGMTAEDITTDTPTNNFCTWNPLDAAANISGRFSEGNMDVDIPGQNVVSNGEGRGCLSTIQFSKGKWYFEVEYEYGANGFQDAGGIGLIRTDTGFDIHGSTNTRDFSDNVFYYVDGPKTIDGTHTSYGNSWTQNDIISVAANLDDNEVYFYKNGTIQNSGTAISKTFGDGFYSIASFHGSSNGGTKMRLNTGNASWSVSSGNSDANGYGNFEYAVPSGYYAICTKNLAQFG